VFGVAASIKNGRTFEEVHYAERSVVSQAARHSSLTNREASGAADFTGKTVSAFTLGSRRLRWLLCRLATSKTRALLLAKVRHKLSAQCFTGEVKSARDSAAICM
jgi:hypothetical protein